MIFWNEIENKVNKIDFHSVLEKLLIIRQTKQFDLDRWLLFKIDSYFCCWCFIGSRRASPSFETTCDTYDHISNFCGKISNYITNMC